MVRDLGGNVVAFVPAGLLLPLGWERFRRLGRTVLAVAAAAGAVEGVQLFTDAVPNFDDVALNVIGTTLGYGLYRASRALVGSAPGRSPVFSEGDGQAPLRVPGR